MKPRRYFAYPAAYAILCQLILMAGSLSVANADEVLMRNGDRLTGEVVRHDAGKLRFKTTYAGTLDIDWGEVSEVILEEPSTVLLQNGSTVEVLEYSRQGDQFTLQSGMDERSLSIAASDVKVIEPDPWELGHGHQFTGQVNISVENESGNSEKDEFDLDFEFHNRWRENHLLSYGELEYDTTRGVKSSENWSWFNNLDHSFSGNWYYAGAVMFKHDRFADLKRRFLIGPGLGHRLFDSDILNLRAELGLYYLKDNFYEQRDETFWGPAWFIDYDQMVWKRRLQIYHRQMGFVAASSNNKFLWRSWTGIRMPLIAGLVGSVEYEIDYDSEPAIEADTTDQTVKLKLGYKW